MWVHHPDKVARTTFTFLATLSWGRWVWFILPLLLRSIISGDGRWGVMLHFVSFAYLASRRLIVLGSLERVRWHCCPSGRTCLTHWWGIIYVYVWVIPCTFYVFYYVCDESLLIHMWRKACLRLSEWCFLDFHELPWFVVGDHNFRQVPACHV